MSSDAPNSNKCFTLDARGLRCPLPVLMARRAFAKRGAKAVLLLTDDPASIIDVPHFCAESGLVLEAREEAPEGFRFRIAKSA